MEWFVLLFLFNFLLFGFFPARFLYTPTPVTIAIHAFFFVLYFRWYKPKENEKFKRIFNATLNYDFSIETSNGILPHESHHRKIIYAVHPHGVYAIALIGYFGFHVSHDKLKVAVSSILFRLPLVKDFCRFTGINTTIKRAELMEALKTHSIAMCPGGLRELLKQPDYVKRKGFIKLAQEANADVCLVTCNQETELYSVFSNRPFLYSMQDWFLRKFLYPFPVLSWGNWLFPFWPKYLKEPMRITVGPIISTENGVSVDDVFNKLYNMGFCFYRFFEFEVSKDIVCFSFKGNSICI